MSNRLSVVKPLDKFSSVCVFVFLFQSILCCSFGTTTTSSEGNQTQQILYWWSFDRFNVFAVALCKRKQKNFPILWLSLTHLTSDKQHNSCSSSALSGLTLPLCKQLFFCSILNGTENIVNGSIFYPTKFDLDTWKIVGIAHFVG